MPMTLAHCSSLRAMMPAICLALLGIWGGGVSAWAQTEPRRSNATNADWPRTFTGQPDFAFTREEAVTEARQRAQRDGSRPPVVPTMVQMGSDEAMPDPLGLRAAAAISNSLALDAGGVSGTADVNINRQSLLDQLLQNASQLPVYATPTAPNMSEFKATLANTISHTIATWQPVPGNYSFGGMLASLTLQTVSTSPETYAVINNKRYVVGDSFLLQIPIYVPDNVIIEALQNLMPAPGSLSEETQKTFTEAYEEAIANYATARSRTPGLGQQIVNIPVKVVGITPRTVRLDVNGALHDLTIRYAY
jgi:hypothetical protein